MSGEVHLTDCTQFALRWAAAFTYCGRDDDPDVHHRRMRPSSGRMNTIEPLSSQATALRRQCLHDRRPSWGCAEARL